MLEAVAALRLADVEALGATGPNGGRARLGDLLGLLGAAASDISESITHRYLVHAVPQRRLGEIDVPIAPA